MSLDDESLPHVGEVLDECRAHVISVQHAKVWAKPTRRRAPDLVTDIDLWVEDRLVRGLTSAYPDCTILSEESYADPSALNSACCFVIDPIDGTREFVAGGSEFAISVARLEYGHVVAGIVDFPRLGTRYVARRGRGARANGARVTINTRRTLAGCRLGVTPRQRINPELAARFDSFARQCELVEIRPLTAKVAAMVTGQIDGCLYLDHHDSHVALWDYAAAALILEEAGGVLVDVRSGTRLLDVLPIRHHGGWVAGSRVLCERLRDAVRAAG